MNACTLGRTFALRLAQAGLLAGLAAASLASLVAADQTVTGNLTVTGTVDVDGNSFTFGTQSSAPGLGLSYADADVDTLTFLLNRNPASFLWAHASSVAAMRLNQNHELVLYKSDGTTAGLTLTPATNTLSLGATTLYRDSTTGALRTNGALTVDGATNLTGAATFTSSLTSTVNDGSATLQNTSAGTAQKFMRLASTGGDFTFGIESSTAGLSFTGAGAYESVLYSPNDALYVRTPNLRLSHDAQVNGTLSVGREYLGAGKLVVEGTMEDVDNADMVIITTKGRVTSSGHYEMYGLSSQMTSQHVPGNVTNTGGFYGITGDAYGNGASATFAGNISRQVGVRGRAGFAPGGASALSHSIATAHVNTAYGGLFEIRNADSDGIIDTAIAVYALNEETTGTINNRYGIYQKGAAAKNFFAGRVGIKTTVTDYDLEVNGTARVSGALNAVGGLAVGGSTAVTITPRAVNTGTGAGSADAELNIGASRTDHGNAYLDLIASTGTYTDYGLRFIREAGVNGAGKLVHRGTGTLQVATAESAPIALATAGTDRLVIAANGAISTSGSLAIGSGAAITSVLHANTTWDPASFNNDAIVSQTLTVMGATVGDVVQATHSSIGSQGVLLSAVVESSDTVRVTLLNKSGSSLDLGSGTLRAVVMRF